MFASGGAAGIRATHMQLCNSSGRGAEEQHQREMERIHELWMQTKEELRVQMHHCEQLESELSSLHEVQQQEHNTALEPLKALNLELRDKLRFTELQLAASREEGSQFSASLQELCTRFEEEQERNVELTQQEPLVKELQAGLQHVEREKQEAVQRFHDEQLRAKDVAQAKDVAIEQLQRKLYDTTSELHRQHEQHAASARAVDAANDRAAEQEKRCNELSLQLLQFKEQLKCAHFACKSEAHSQSELRQLQADNKRLVRILGSTDEYRQ